MMVGLLRIFDDTIKTPDHEKSIYPCITLKGKAEEAADFYISTFGEGLILQKSPFVTQIQLSGETFMRLVNR